MSDKSFRNGRMFQDFRFAKMSTLLLSVLAVPVTVQAVVIDDFESYATGAAPGSPWVNIENSSPSTPTVESNANNISGNHLQFSSTYPYDSIGRALPNTLANNGDYIQVAVRYGAGQTVGVLTLDSQPFPGGGAYAGRAGIGIDSLHNQFTNFFLNSASDPNDFGSPTANTWYYLRATMRDNGGVAGQIDSYDFQVYSDAAGTSLVAQRLGIVFDTNDEGPMTHIAFRTFEQNAQTAVVLFDEITTNVVPEPSSVAITGLIGIGLGVRRRQRM